MLRKADSVVIEQNYHNADAGQEIRHLPIYPQKGWNYESSQKNLLSGLPDCF